MMQTVPLTGSLMRNGTDESRLGTEMRGDIHQSSCADQMGISLRDNALFDSSPRFVLLTRWAPILMFVTLT